MKNLTKIICAIALLAGFAVNASAQATAVATATIVAPISIAHSTDLVFGTIIATAAGTVTVPPTGVRTFTGVTIPAVSPYNAASFNVTGGAGLTYSISLPGAITVSDGATHTMGVGTWTSSPTVATGGTLTGGAETLYVGATLTVGAGQVPGTYTSAPFTVTVAYN